jgi:ABC-2 type transport system permease protein
MGLVYSAVVWLPAVVWSWTAVEPGPAAVVFSILLLFFNGLLILTLTCLLGWVVALAGSRVRRKSLVTVVLSLLFLGLYFYGYSRMSELMQLIVQNTERFGAAVRSWLWPIYQLGLAATGDTLPMLLYCALALCLAALVYLILTRSFLAIATTERGAKKAEYRGGTLKTSGLGSALLKKELRRFLGSPVYLLNCGLGFILLLAAAVLLLVKAETVREALNGVLAGMPQVSGLLPLLGVFAVCAISGTTVTTSPSVSLEGKNLWLLQSYPVPAREALKAKVRLHLCLGGPPALLCALVFGLVLRLEPLCLLAGLLIVLLDVWAMADLGLALNLWKPNLSWTNETAPVKQSLPVLLTMVFGWLLAVAVTAACFALSRVMAMPAAMLLGALLPALLLLGLERWLRRRGTAIFEGL